MPDEDNKIKMFGSDDDLKSLGELLSNETSRTIIKNLMEYEMYTNEIATKLDMRVSLVIHHLKKMEALGLLEISDKKIEDVKLVISGAGAAAISCTRLYQSFGARKENIVMLDSKGVIRKDRDNLS